MTPCTLNENSKIVISQLFSQQSSTTDLDTGEKYPLSSSWALIFPLKWFINKTSISIWKARVKGSSRIPGVAPDLFRSCEARGAHICITLGCRSWVLRSAEGLSDTHTTAELEKTKGHRHCRSASWSQGWQWCCVLYLERVFITSQLSGSRNSFFSVARRNSSKVTSRSLLMSTCLRQKIKLGLKDRFWWH